MKTVFFTEEQLADLDKIGKELFCDEQDPRSSAYNRKLNRPPISWTRIILNIVAPIFALSLLVVALKTFGLSITIAIVIAALLLMVYIVFTIKRACICIVKIYQRYAPASLRNKCRFEPSCSEYMILAIEKYGVVKGIKKGICRLKRCNIDGGGFDFP